MRESLIAEVERGLVFYDGEDNNIRKSHSSNVYIVFSGCDIFYGFNVSANLHSPALLWKGFTSPKIDVFIWLLLNGSICTKGFLVERRIINYKEALCPFCCKEIETIHHLFHLCPTSWSLWGKLFSWFGCVGCLPKDPNHNLQEWSGLVKGKFQRQAITLLCTGLYWLIWIAHNYMIFDSKTPDWDVIFDLTFHRLAFWLKFSVKNFSYIDSDLYRNPECIINWTN